MSFKVWMVEVRAPFLLLPIILSLVGSFLALYNGVFDALNFILFTAVLLLLHVTVNTLNEYYDNKTGIDLHTNRTMFNGGTGTLQNGLLAPRQVLGMAIGCFIIAAIISAVLVVRVGPVLIPLVLMGMVFALFYTQIFARNMLGEISAGLGLGFLPVVGAYMVHIPLLSIGCLVLAVAAGILTFNLLLLNEFPDVEADTRGGRKNLAIKLGPRRAAVLYSALTFLVYGILLVFVLLQMIPTLCLLGLVTFPFAYKAATTSFSDPTRVESFVHALKANVQVVLITQVLVVIGIGASLLLRS
ncbi:MAG: prenyltransferase [Methanomassiliicoccus sp.]|nr:prenyltransferase [Methanomassiliicoccus sp.]